jgi:hypothetical protein
MLNCAKENVKTPRFPTKKVSSRHVVDAGLKFIISAAVDNLPVEDRAKKLNNIFASFLNTTPFLFPYL